MEQPYILIVDDSKEMLTYMEIVLKSAKATIISANSGSKALELIKNKELALAIIDVQMPEMNGYTLALKINENRLGAIVPIIFLTAVYQDQVEILKGYESGAVDYIFKPVNRGILLSKINVFLELYNQRMNLPEDLILLKKFEDNLSKSNAELADSQVKFKSFIEHAPDGVFIMNKEGRYLEMNDAVSSITGYRKEDLLQMPLHDLIPEGSKGKWNSFIMKLLNTGTANTELTFRHRNGKTRWCTVDGVKLSDEQYLCFSKDITQNKIAADALMKSEEKYRTLLNASPEGIIIVDLKGIITDVSEIGIELYGADTQNELIGKHILRFLPSGLKSKFRDIYNKTLEEGLVQSFELKLQNKSNIPFISEISTTLIQGKNGESIAFMIVIHDITHRKKLERQMIHNDRMTTLGEMATGIAHEINQPLNTLSILFDNMLLAASKEDSLPKSYLEKKTEKIYDNIFRIKNIIDHVRVFSRSQDDAIYSSFEVNESIKNAASMISEQFRHKMIELDIDLSNLLPPAFGNTYQFEQVILNLLINSKDAIEELEASLGMPMEKKVSIRTYQLKKLIIVEVKDNGIGIKPEELEKIMLPFYTTKEAGKGTGLGLSITFGIIKEMNGEIAFQSEPNNGTKVTIKLPEAKR
ncbi:MAG: PAS domain S-box protein [Prolixibacteraceae bacterium]|jgi:PAS domain S-box-containing protein|nr:PAS domain S-box protein [Prolixibacteraceae bacterium]